MRGQMRGFSRENERQLRAGQTEAERLTWNMVRGRRLGGYKFRRQHRFGDYILDFYCPELRLGIELDGEHHFTEGGKLGDEIRTRYLAEQGITIIRFENHDVIANPTVVAETVLAYASSLSPQATQASGEGTKSGERVG